MGDLANGFGNPQHIAPPHKRWRMTQLMQTWAKHPQSPIEEEIGLTATSKNRGKNSNSPKRG